MILVTGGAGFIGSNFLHYLHKVTDERVVVLDSLTYAANEKYIPDHCEFIWCDIRNEDHVNYIFNKHRPNKVFHFAAESHVDRSIGNSNPFISTNINGTINLLNASLDVEVEKFHHISTDEVYGSLEYDDTELFNEKTPYDPRNPYSATKAAADLFIQSWARTHGLDYLIVRPSNNYGLYQYPEKLIPVTVRKLQRGKSIKLHNRGKPIRTWTHAEDTIDAMMLLFEKADRNRVYNISMKIREVW